MARQRRPQRRTKSESNTPADESIAQSSPRRRIRGRRILAIGLVLLAVTLFFLPNIAAVTPLRQLAIDLALANFNGRVTAKSASWSWLSPLTLNGVVASDENDQLLLKVERISSSKSLLSLLSGNEYGRFDIQQPEMHLTLRDDGSNFEDAIADLFESNSDEPSPPLELSISGGSAQVTVAHEQRVWVLQQLNGSLGLSQGDAAMHLALTGSVSAADVEAGPFAAEIQFDPQQTQLTFAEGSLSLQGKELPINVLSSIVTRFIEPATVSGFLTGEVRTRWKQWGRSVQIETEQATVREFQSTWPKRIGRDRIQLANLQLNGSLAVSPDWIAADRFSCATEIGLVRANGQLGWQQFYELTSAGSVPDADFEADGRLDAARLAAMLPETIRLQPGLSIDSGEVNFNVNSHRQGADRRLVLNTESTRLSATRDGQRLQWSQPVRFVGVLRRSAEATFIESLNCQTSFLTIEGAADREQGEFTVTGDLAAALSEARQIFDVGQLQLRGKLDGKLAWQFDGDPQAPWSDRPLRIGSRLHIAQPLVHWPGRTHWEQPELNLLIQASGQRIATADQSTGVRLNQGNLQIKAGTEELSAELQQPVMNPGLRSTWNMSCKISGHIGRWLSQIKTVAPIEVQASGNVNASAIVVASPNKVELQQFKYQLDEVAFSGYGLDIREPQVGGEAQLSYDLASAAIQVADLTVVSSTVSARARPLAIQFAGNRPGLMNGLVSVRADVNRLSKWFAGDPAATAQRPSGIQWFGSAEGTLQLAAHENGIDGKVYAAANDLIAARPTRTAATHQLASGSNVARGAGWTKLLEEKQVTLESTLQLSHSLDQLSFSQLALSASAAQITASGQIADLRGNVVTDIQGSWAPRWERLKPLVESYLGDLASFDEIRGERFVIRGPIFSPLSGAAEKSRVEKSWVHPDLLVSTAASWQRGQILGMPIGPSHVKLSLSQSIAAMETGSIPLSGGAAQLSPRLDLRGPHPILLMPAGKKLDQVQLTPAVCRGWLRYVAPLLAEVTTAEGQFSLITDDLSLPLNDLERAEVGGKITLHRAQVGPGPLGQQLIGLVSQVKTLASGSPLGAIRGAAVPVQSNWISLGQQTVPFRMKDGRVYHNGLSFKIEDVTIQTRGSVGLDQSLQMVASVPILESWLGNRPWLAGLKGQTLQIPIAGTVTQPRLDASVVQKLSQQLVGQAAANAAGNQLNNLIEQGNKKIENELIKGLDKLLGPKK